MKPLKLLISLFIIILLAGIIYSKPSEIVKVDFKITDSFGNPIENALVIIQGISNQDFSTIKITDNSGIAFEFLNKNEIFLYTIYKSEYDPETGNFFTGGDKTLSITLNKTPENKWQFYYMNNGEVELKFKSLDSDTSYSGGDFINEILEVRNVGEKNLKLSKEKSALDFVDSSELKRLRWWGTMKSEEILVDLTLKKDGWVKTTIRNFSVETCVGNALVVYKGQFFDLSGSEFLCEEEFGDNQIPAWMIKGDYRFILKVFYSADNVEKNLSLVTQKFSIDNPEWKPEITSFPNTKINLGDSWEYDILPKYLLNFVYYHLKASPAGMKIDPPKGIVTWKPEFPGFYNVSISADYSYFYDNSKVVSNIQNFTIEVFSLGNLELDRTYLFNNTIKEGEYAKGSFRVYNNDYRTNSFSYELKKGDGTSVQYLIKDMEPYEKRTIYVYWKYNSSGTFIPEIKIDSSNEISELNEEDNHFILPQINVISGGFGAKKLLLIAE